MGFFLTVIYIILIFLRPQEFIAEMRGWPILDVLSVFCMAAVFLEGGFEAAKFNRSTLNWLVIWFWLSLAVSQIANLWFGGAINALTDFAKTVLVYYLVILTVDSFRRIKILLWVMVIMTVFLSFQAILQFYSGVGIVGGEALQRGEVMQAKGIGIFGDPNDLALNMVSLIPFLLPAIHKPVLSRTSITGIILLIPVVTGVVFTRSRGRHPRPGPGFLVLFIPANGPVFFGGRTSFNLLHSSDRAPHGRNFHPGEFGPFPHGALVRRPANAGQQPHIRGGLQPLHGTSLPNCPQLLDSGLGGKPACSAHFSGWLCFSPPFGKYISPARCPGLRPFLDPLLTGLLGATGGVGRPARSSSATLTSF